jgi:hypothetical protein
MRGGLGEEERKREERGWVRLAYGPHYRVLGFENEIGILRSYLEKKSHILD